MFDLVQAVERWDKPRILVVGDIMLDRYSSGVVERISPEAPVPVLSQLRNEIRLGGAASVAGLLAHLGCSVQLAGLVGNDADGRSVVELLRSTGVDSSLVLVDDERPTTTKHRFLGRSEGCQARQMLRVDNESRSPARHATVAQWSMALESHLPTLDAVLVSDYDKGVCTTTLIPNITKLARPSGLPVVIDPARTVPGSGYGQATCITPNRLEAARMLSRPIAAVDDAISAARELTSQLDLAGAIVTLDADGIALSHGEECRHFPTSVREVCDITGAGDMVLAVVGICLANGQDWSQAAQLANVAAGIEIQRLGVAPVTRKELLAELASAECWTDGPTT